jgi:secreted Zn-dependent insulinase-like peptidase
LHVLVVLVQHAGVRVTEGIPYLVLIVQSNVADAVTVTERIMAFVDKMAGDIINPMSDEEFDSFVVGLVKKRHSFS